MKCYLCKKEIKGKPAYEGYDYARKKDYVLCKECNEISIVDLSKYGKKK